MKPISCKFLLSACILLTSLGANAQIITTFAGNGTPAYAGDGMAATTASLNTPTDIACDTAGNIFIADEFNHVIRKVTPAGIISTIAGTGMAGYSGDGGPATLAKFNRPTNVFVKGGNIYITDEFNHAIRKIDTGGIIQTVAGTGSPGYSGDGGPATAALLFQPYGIFVDNSGNIYISEQVNQVIRKVSASGMITNVAGTGFSGYSGDGGPATAAKFHDPSDVTFDPSGNLLIADRHNHAIRKINASGIIVTIAGTGTAGYTGDGSSATAAQLNEPTELVVDVAGNIFFSDGGNNVIRKINTSGIISTVAGNGTSGYSGDGVAATAARLATPHGVTLDLSGNLLLADSYNNRIRKISNVSTFSAWIKEAQHTLRIFPNPNNGTFYISGKLSASTADNITVEIRNMLGQPVYSRTEKTLPGEVNIKVDLNGSLPEGIYVALVTYGTERQMYTIIKNR